MMLSRLAAVILKIIEEDISKNDKNILSELNNLDLVKKGIELLENEALSNPSNISNKKFLEILKKRKETNSAGMFYTATESVSRAISKLVDQGDILIYQHGRYGRRIHLIMKEK